MSSNFSEEFEAGRKKGIKLTNMQVRYASAHRAYRTCILMSMASWSLTKNKGGGGLDPGIVYPTVVAGSAYPTASRYFRPWTVSASI